LKARGAALSVGAAVHIVCETLQGLHAAHTLMRDGKPLSVVHRDVTPENLLLTSAGAVKVVDFGIARASGARRFTQTGTVKGKLPYLAPDLLQGGVASPGTDLYSVGVVLYELLTGKVPFEAESEGTLLYKVLYAPAVAPSQLRPEVSRELDAVVLRCIARDPQERYGDALALVAALRQAAAPELAALDLNAFAAWVDGARGPEDAQALPTQLSSAPRSLPDAAGGTQPMTPGRAGRARWLGAAAVTLGVLGLGAWQLETPAEAPLPVVAAAPAVVEPAPPAPVAEAAREPEPPPPVAEPVAVPPAPPAAAKKAPLKGKLQVFAKPWADVFWHGTKLGVTPLVQPVSLPAGVQVLTLRNDSLGVEKEFKVQIRAGSIAELRANLLER
jgi:hypothetical protein